DARVNSPKRMISVMAITRFIGLSAPYHAPNSPISCGLMADHYVRSNKLVSQSVAAIGFPSWPSRLCRFHDRILQGAACHAKSEFEFRQQQNARAVVHYVLRSPMKSRCHLQSPSQKHPPETTVRLSAGSFLGSTSLTGAYSNFL